MVVISLTPKGIFHNICPILLSSSEVSKFPDRGINCILAQLMEFLKHSSKRGIHINLESDLFEKEENMSMNTSAKCGKGELHTE